MSEAVEFAKERSLRIFLLGAGTNLILGNHIDGLVIKNNLRGKTFSENEVKASSGENWEELVRSCDSKSFPGLENLGLIPGTVGAAPIQNIGAYGTEVSDFVDEVEAFDRSGEKLILKGSDCEFGYRTSIFKSKNDFIIGWVTFKLLKMIHQLSKVRQWTFSCLICPN